MAYFSNSSDGEQFESQCDKCIFGKEPCPIAFIQMEYNYTAASNDTATKILNHLVQDDGTCTMWNQFQSKLEFKLEENDMFGDIREDRRNKNE